MSARATEPLAIVRKLAEDVTRCFDANQNRKSMAIGITREEARALSALATPEPARAEREVVGYRVRDVDGMYITHGLSWWARPNRNGKAPPPMREGDARELLARARKHFAPFDWVRLRLIRVTRAKR